MADRTPVKATIVSGAATGLAEFASGDTVSTLAGGTGLSVAALTDLIAALGGHTTGDFKMRQAAAADAGWIVGNGGTIGSASSGASRANSDTQALFTLWWTDYTDAQLPILTSAGGASTRGASAAADWAANKRLTVFDVRDRVPRAAGTTQVNGTKLEATEVYDQFGISGTGVWPFTSNSTNNSDGAGTKTTNLNSAAVTAAGNLTVATAKVRVASLGMLGCYKL